MERAERAVKDTGAYGKETPATATLRRLIIEEEEIPMMRFRSMI